MHALLLAAAFAACPPDPPDYSSRDDMTARRFVPDLTPDRRPALPKVDEGASQLPEAVRSRAGFGSALEVRYEQLNRSRFASVGVDPRTAELVGHGWGGGFGGR